MMRELRAKTRVIMIVTALAFVGWMVLEVGMDITGQGGTSISDNIATVNGEKITSNLFYAAVRNAQEQQRQAGAPAFTLDDQRVLEDQVLESLIQQFTLQGEFRRRGIGVTDNEIRQAAMEMPLPEMYGVPQFQTDGRFDLTKYQRYLQSQQDLQFMLAIEERYREELPQRKLIDRLTADVFLTDGKLWRLYRDRHDSAAAKVLTIFPQTAIEDNAVDLSDEELEDYYRAHSEDFQRPARAHLSYIAVSRVPNAADSAFALEYANEILVELRAGSDFAEIATRESADSGTRLNGGDLGEVTRGQHVPAFADAAMALNPGEISDPVLTSYGYHIIRLQSKSETGYHASHILVPIELQGDHLDEVESLGDSLDFHAAELEDPTALDLTASMLEIPIEQAAPLSQGDRLRIGAYVIPDVGIWAFQTFEGETSHVIEADHAYYVFRLDRLEEEGTPPLEEIIDEVTFRATNARKWELAETLATQVHQDLESGMSFENAAVTHGLRSQALDAFTRLVPGPVIAGAPEAIGAAFGLPIGQTSGPIKTDQAIFFVQPTARVPADSAAFLEELDGLRESILQDARQLRIQLVLTSIRASADVTDRREDLARAQRAQARALGGGPLAF